MPKTGPTEASEHARLAAALRRARIYFVHVPMGGARGRNSGSEARRMGASKGFHDILILDSPPRRCVVAPESDTWCEVDRGVWAEDACECDLLFLHKVGVALELKRCVRGARSAYSASTGVVGASWTTWTSCTAFWAAAMAAV